MDLLNTFFKHPAPEVETGVGMVFLSMLIFSGFFFWMTLPYAPIPFASGFGVGFGYLNTF